MTGEIQAREFEGSADCRSTGVHLRSVCKIRGNGRGEGAAKRLTRRSQAIVARSVGGPFGKGGARGNEDRRECEGCCGSRDEGRWTPVGIRGGGVRANRRKGRQPGEAAADGLRAKMWWVRTARRRAKSTENTRTVGGASALASRGTEGKTGLRTSGPEGCVLELQRRSDDGKCR